MEAKKQKILSFEGLLVPPFTAYDSDGKIQLNGIGKYAEYLSKNGVSGLFLNGTTGDSLSLSSSERKSLTEEWICKGKTCMDLIIVHVGTNCMEETKDLARHAEKHGADAIAVLPPVYYKPNNDDELISYLEEVSLSAPVTPLMYYHIPSMSGVNVTLSTFVGKAQSKIPNFCGAKYTSTDLRDLAFCQAKHRDTFKLMLGSDELTLAALTYGVNAAIGITHNMMGPRLLRVFEEFKNGNLSRALEEQNEVIEILRKLLKHGTLFQVLRVAMNHSTPIDVGEPRAPLYPLIDMTCLIKDLECTNLT